LLRKSYRASLSASPCLIYWYRDLVTNGLVKVNCRTGAEALCLLLAMRIHSYPFEPQQCAFLLQASAEAGEASVSADNAVAGY
jgi:hypothetical protein